MGNQFNTGYLKKQKIVFIAVSVLIVVLFTALIAARSNKVKQNEQQAAIAEQETAVSGQEQSEQEQSEQASAVEQAAIEQGQEELAAEQPEAEKEQLEAMNDYLEQAGQTVVENQESLARAGLMQAETQQTLSDFSERLSVLEDSLLCVENLIDRHAENLAGQNGEMEKAVSELSADGQETVSQIRALSSSVSSLLSGIKASEAGNSASVSEKLSGLQEALSTAEKNTKEYHDSLTKTINLLQKENADEHKELIQALDDTRKETASILEKGFSGILSQMEQEYGSLMEKMGTLHDQITGTRKDISGLLEFIGKYGEEKQNEVRKAFVNVVASVEQIRADYADACQEISSLIRELGAAQNADHEETLAVLSAMENSMAESSMKNMENITSSMQGMADNLSVSMSGMQGEMAQGFSGINSEMSQLLSEYNIYMTERFDLLENQLFAGRQDSATLADSMREEMAQNFLELENRLEGMFERLDKSIAGYSRLVMDTADRHNAEKKLDLIEQELQQVFQSVSDGKNKLASALLTKGVSIRKDAAFDEICHAILSIHQGNGFSGEEEGTGTETEKSEPEKETEKVTDTDPEKSEPEKEAEKVPASESEAVGESTGTVEGDTEESTGTMEGDTEENTRTVEDNTEECTGIMAEEAGQVDMEESMETETETSGQGNDQHSD